ncbi:MAG: hypothetical protein WC007_13235 [Pelobacteraceae bacterium]
MGNRALKKRIESLKARINEHRHKIENELMNLHPDEGLIHHWEAEISAFAASIERAEKRLG